MSERFASRERVTKSKHDYFYNIELIEFCSNGDVVGYGKGLKDDEEKIESALNIYQQMTDILINFGSNNALFPDLKPTNFLVTKEGKVIIADMKSFIETVDGKFNQAKVKEKQYYLYTQGMEPPELMKDRECTTLADKHHAYLLGISLYLYLTGQDVEDVPDTYPGHLKFVTFDDPIFKTEKGKAFQLLIQDLLKEKPEERLGLDEAKYRLDVIHKNLPIENLSFKSNNDVYFYAIHHLMQINTNHPNQRIRNLIESLKIGVENHEQNPNSAAERLETLSEQLKTELSPLEIGELKAIARIIRSSSYEQSLQEKYENPLARRFESQMQIELLQHPTNAMMRSVGEISKRMLDVFEQIESSDPPDLASQKLLSLFPGSLTVGKQQTGFGSQVEEITLETVKNILKKNDPKDLNQILFIQFLFAQNCMRKLPGTIEAPNIAMPTGKLKQIIEEYNHGEFKENPKAFFDELTYDKLILVSNTKLYNAPLFTAESGRGRQDNLGSGTSSRMGVMLEGQPQDDLPVDQSSWTPDAKYQAANLDSIYVRDLIENDAVYVAGPSGMTSLFLNIMELYGNFQTVEEKQHYLAAVSAYMVSGGFHSLHEVIGPAQYGLDLVPGYNVTPPQQDHVAPPP